VAVQYNIIVRADRDFYLPVSLVSEQNNPSNLTGYLPVMTVKTNLAQADAAALYHGGPWSQNLAFGQFTFKIPRGTNANWFVGSGPISTSVVYDVSVQDTAALATNWVTLVEGSVTIIGPVTKTIP
jgi:hypothetical protein